jgi:hypothetical protein
VPRLAELVGSRKELATSVLHAHPELTMASAPYREGSVERRGFACPSCNTLALAETEESAICSRCDIRFSTREPAPAIQQIAIRHPAQSLAPRPVQRGLTPLDRWRLTTRVVVALAIAGWYGGVVGAAFAGVAVAIGTLIAVAMRDLRRDSR